jgi:hypothetical protein
MSSDITIKNQAQNHQRLLQNLQKKNAYEMAHLERNHKANVETVKDLQTSDLNNMEIEHDHHVSEAELRKDRAIMDMSHNLEKTKKLTERELKNLKQNSEKEKKDIREKLEVEVLRQSLDNEIVMQDTNDKFQGQIKDLSGKSQDKIQRIKDETRQQTSDEKNIGQSKVDFQRSEYIERFNKDRDQFDRIKYNQKEQFEKSLAGQNLEGQMRVKKLNENQIKERERVSDHHDKTLAEQDQFYEKKFQSNLGTHSAYLKNLENRHAEVVNSMKKSVLNSTELAKTRSLDPFYNFTELKPTLEETEKGWILKMNVPEHSKDHVSLTTNNKEIIVSVNRRFNEERVDSDGTKNRIQKVETALTNLPVKTMIDPRYQKKSWDDGILTYELKKA